MQLFAVIVAERRMSYFVAGLTNDDPDITAPVYQQYHHVQYGESLPPSATASVSFPPTTGYTFRYVIIQQQFANTDAICVAEVRVYLRGRPTSTNNTNCGDNCNDNVAVLNYCEARFAEMAISADIYNVCINIIGG